MFNIYFKCPSKYNKNLFVSRCMICSYMPTKNTDKPLETHHIIFQKDADEYQSIHYQQIIPLLVYEIQELKKRLHN